MVSRFFGVRFGDSLWMGLGVILFMGVFFHERKVYDLATAFFFAVCLALMVRMDWAGYFVAFAFGCLNRETMVLLAMVFAVHYWGRMGRRLWVLVMLQQAFLFVGTRIALMAIFADAPGSMAWMRLGENLQWLFDHPFWLGVHWVVFVGVMWIVIRHESQFVREAGWVLMVALVGLYLVFGWVGEVRVFAEGWALMWVASSRFQVPGAK